MAQETLVGMQFKEGRRLLDRLAREGVPVTAAAWVKESESGDWYLYLATPLVAEDGGEFVFAGHHVEQASAYVDGAAGERERVEDGSAGQ